MTIEQLRTAYQAQPLQAFILHLADGRHLPVMSREYIATFPNERTLMIIQPNGTWNIVDLLLVTDLEFRSPQNGAPRRRGQK